MRKGRDGDGLEREDVLGLEGRDRMDWKGKRWEWD